MALVTAMVLGGCATAGDRTGDRTAAAERRRAAAAEAAAEVERRRVAEAEEPAVPAAEVERRRVAEAEERRLAEWRRSGRLFRDCDACPEMVMIPAGTFMMGSPASEEGRDDDEGPRHEVTLRSPFALGRYEVTRAEYAAFVSATGHDMSGGCLVQGFRPFPFSDIELTRDENASWRSPGFAQGDDHPVVCVSWRDAQAFVEWLSRETGERYQLPSEAEWEYAARAGTATPRWWGDAQQCEHANGGDATYEEVLRRFREDADWNAAECTDGSAWTAPVGSFSPNDFGLHDVLGNVLEWVEDCWHGTYARAPADGSAWTSGGNCGRRVLRGGGWGTPTLRSATRGWGGTSSRLGAAGFRVSRTPTPTPAEAEAAESALNLDQAGWRRIQEGLVALGFDPGAPDGLAGVGTRRAVRAYQEGARKAVTGFVDAADVTTLRDAAARACRVGQVLSPGQSCTSTNGRSFEVNSDGDGCTYTADLGGDGWRIGGLRICNSRDPFVNFGSFRASRIDGTSRWRIDARP